MWIVLYVKGCVVSSAWSVVHVNVQGTWRVSNVLNSCNCIATEYGRCWLSCLWKVLIKVGCALSLVNVHE